MAKTVKKTTTKPAAKKEPAVKTTKKPAVSSVKKNSSEKLVKSSLHSVESIKKSFIEHLEHTLGIPMISATTNDLYMALSLTVRERMFEQDYCSIDTYCESETRIVAYLSAEYLPGPHLAINLLNLGITDAATKALKELAIDIKDLIKQEEEPGLGNGGLGRLASCYSDSLASLEIPAVSYGIRYEFGIFDQMIRDGWQVEITDKWLRYGNPWELNRPELAFEVKFGGHTESWTDGKGKYHVKWIPESMVKGIAFDTPILGYKVKSCNPLRLWKAEAIESFDFHAFNHGDYYRAVQDKMASENITKVLYPNDEAVSGKILRLKQQFFFVSCSLQDMIKSHLNFGRKLDKFHEKWVIQLNDTHPAIAVAELMRLLMDENNMGWDKAWEVTKNTFAYTNHTLLPEALEKWALPIFQQVLPRHLEIIFAINEQFLKEVQKKFPDDHGLMARLSLIDENGPKYVRMANLACVGSKKINGVARLHSDLLKQTVLKDFAQLWPEKFLNVTNGVTPRRFVSVANPSLDKLITEAIGDGWLQDMSKLKQLEKFAKDASFKKQWEDVKLTAKKSLAGLIKERTGIEVLPESMFDILVKRIHEYKRQHLKALHIIAEYLQIKKNPKAEIVPRTFFFGGKAAPGYHMAKLIIKFINSIADLVNNDKDVRNRLKVVFFPDYNVTNAHFVFPAANLSEQISMAGKEASGTGNMKFAMNGALTIGTLDGANVEIREEVGKDNFFLFGLNVEEVHDLKKNGYIPKHFFDQNEVLREVMNFAYSGALARGNTDLFRPLLDKLLWDDPFMLFADFQSYLDCNDKVDAVWKKKDAWTTMSILNAARVAKFSSDRSINDYCRMIWDIKPFKR